MDLNDIRTWGVSYIEIDSDPKIRKRQYKGFNRDIEQRKKEALSEYNQEIKEMNREIALNNKIIDECDRLINEEKREQIK